MNDESVVKANVACLKLPSQY